MLSKHVLIGPIILLAVVLFGYPAYWLYAASIPIPSAHRDLRSRRIESRDRSILVE
jgi:hypothetical protein